MEAEAAGADLDLRAPAHGKVGTGGQAPARARAGARALVALRLSLCLLPCLDSPREGAAAVEVDLPAPAHPVAAVRLEVGADLRAQAPAHRAAVVNLGVIALPRTARLEIRLGLHPARDNPDLDLARAAPSLPSPYPLQSPASRAQVGPLGRVGRLHPFPRRRVKGRRAVRSLSPMGGILVPRRTQRAQDVRVGSLRIIVEGRG